MRPHLLFLPVFCVATAPGADLERGREIYAQLCFNCHGSRLEGGQGPALNDSYWQHGSSPEAILRVIDKGVPGSAMIPYGSVFPESDRIALRDFILSEQEGLRETVRSIYPRDYFQGKRFTPALFNSVESLSQTPMPENFYYFARNDDGILRGRSKLYIREGGVYDFKIGPVGRTSIFVNGEEVYYFDQEAKKETHFSKSFELAPGIHDLEILHEEKASHRFRFSGTLRHRGGKEFALNGRSLQGNIPKVIKVEPGVALVVRKWIEGLPPRTLLCLLPNKVIVAYHPVDGRVLGAWHSAEINQTPSLPDRSTAPSEIRGTPIPGVEEDLINADRLRFLYYETRGETVYLVSGIDGEQTRIAIAPEGEQSFIISVD